MITIEELQKVVDELQWGRDFVVAECLGCITLAARDTARFNGAATS